MPHEAEFPNWFRTWCNVCQAYTPPTHRCTTPGDESVEAAHIRLEDWLKEPFSYKD